MSKPTGKGDFIDGRFAKPTNPTAELRRENPSNPAEIVGIFPYSFDSADAAVHAARRAFPPWALLSSDERWVYLNRLAEVFQKRQEILTLTLTQEIGKPLWEAKQEIANVQNKFKLTAQSQKELVAGFTAAAVNPMITAQCRFKPRGPLVVIAPFNFPLHLAMGHIIPALATGNTVILKPSELAPKISEELAECFLQADLPPGVFNLVQGDGRIGKALCDHVESAGVLFTGSYRVGKEIQRALLDHPQKITVLEMGGKNASVIWEDAKLEQAAALALQSAVITTGQRCTCTSRLYVHEAIWERVIERLGDLHSRLSIGDPLGTKTFLGPLVSSGAKERFAKAGEDALRRGQKPLSQRAAPLPTTGYFVAPAIYLAPSIQDDAGGDEEVFAPHLTVFPVRTLNETVAAVEASRYGLATSIFTQNESTFQEFFRGVTAGVINWNRPTTGASSALPFGGQKASGNQFPTAYFAPYYCTYPVAAMLDPSGASLDTYPGFPDGKKS